MTQSQMASPASPVILRLMRFLLFLLPLCFLGCNHLPVGFDQLDRGIGSPEFKSPPADEGSGRCYGAFNANNSTGTLGNLVIGRSSEYESRILLHFTLADSAPNIDSVDSARFVLHTRTYHAVPFNIYALNSQWDDYQTTWHDAQTAQPWFTPGGDFDPLHPIQSGTIGVDSTVVILPSSVLDTLVKGAFGLILVPQPTDSSNFAVVYSRLTADDTPSITYCYGTKRREFGADQNTYIVDTMALGLGRGQLWLGSGYVFRSYVKFNLDSLRPDSTSTVITAALTVRPETIISSRETLQVGVHRLTEGYEPDEENASFDANAIATQQFILPPESALGIPDTVPNIDIRPLVQFWVDHPDSNFGMLLTLEPPYFDVSRVELKTGDSVPSLRIGYVKPPQGRFQ
jgi:hypothetical protein